MRVPPPVLITSSPRAKLDVSGSIYAEGSTPLSTGSGIEMAYNTSTNHGYIQSATIGTANRSIVFGGGDLRFATTLGGDISTLNTINERMRITNTGNVGIGTTNPQGRLAVAGTAGVQSIYFESSLGKAVFNNYDADVSTSFNISGTAGSTSRLFSIHSGGASQGALFEVYGHNGTSFIHAITVANDGNVGIGTTNPTYKLHVNGKIKTDDITETSDKRLKKILLPFPMLWKE